MKPGDKRNKEPISVDFYNAADGPNIRIDLQSSEQLDLVIGLFLSLAKQEVQEVRIHEQEEFRLNGLRSLTLSTVSENTHHNQSIFLTGELPQEPDCEWKNRPSDWEDCLSLIKGDDDSSRPQSWHQYLNMPRIALDDATVVISFMEPFD